MRALPAAAAAPWGLLADAQGEKSSERAAGGSASRRAPAPPAAQAMVNEGLVDPINGLDDYRLVIGDGDGAK